jgi:hypothetical protein
MKTEKKKAPGIKEFPRSLHIRSFWKTHFINPPEVQVGLLACSFKGRIMTETKYQNSPFGLPLEIYTFQETMSTEEEEVNGDQWLWGG